MTTTRQEEVAHAQAKVGFCPFCGTNSAELWFDPANDWNPFQVRCMACGARGPESDCGWESAVPAWDGVRRLADVNDTHWRGPGSNNPDPHAPANPV